MTVRVQNAVVHFGRADHDTRPTDAVPITAIFQAASSTKRKNAQMKVFVKIRAVTNLYSR
jgi:hypothetical protein